MGVIAAAAVAGVATVGSAFIAADAQKSAAQAAGELPPLFNPRSTSPYAGANDLLAAALGLPPTGGLQSSGPVATSIEIFRVQERSGEAYQFMRLVGEYVDALNNGVTIDGQYLSPSAVANMVGPPREEVFTDPLNAEGYATGIAPRDPYASVSSGTWGLLNVLPGGFDSMARPRKARQQFERMLGLTGWDSIDALLDAQVEHNRAVADSLETRGVVRESAQGLIRDAWQKRTEAMASLPGGTAADIEEYRTAEEERMAEDFERYDRDALRKAQFGGFNPSAGLEESARLRETGNNQALARALMLISGEQAAASQNISLINQLDPMTAYIQSVPAFSEAGLPVPIGTPRPGAAPGGSPWADAVSNLGNLAGEALLTYDARNNAVQDSYTPGFMGTDSYSAPPGGVSPAFELPTTIYGSGGG